MRPRRRAVCKSSSRRVPATTVLQQCSKRFQDTEKAVEHFFQSHENRETQDKSINNEPKNEAFEKDEKFQSNKNTETPDKPIKNKHFEPKKEIFDKDQIVDVKNEVVNKEDFQTPAKLSNEDGKNESSDKLSLIKKEHFGFE